MSNNLPPQIAERAAQWTKAPFDEATRQEVTEMLQNDPTSVTDAFYRDLEFGTGGLRGIMGAGTNRMNIYTVGMATQGLANYLLKNYGPKRQISAVISFDSRNNNTLFANTVAGVLSANGIKVFIFDDIRPTPELSFAIRYLKCQTGIMITASHNPKEYNGYKVYWEDGAQIIDPHDKGIIGEVRAIKHVDEVKIAINPKLVETIGAEIDDAYLCMVSSLSIRPDLIKKHHNLKIVYTPIHGTGTRIAPMALKKFGFDNIITVEKQMVPDGNFPTVHSPNPEEPAALKMAIEKAKATGASLVMATDPDADRVGIAIPDNKGDFILLNGNQTAAILQNYIITQRKAKGDLTGKEYIVKTIVTTELLADMAHAEGIPCYDVLTGFKYIAGMIRSLEGKQTYLFGGEESYGYLIGDAVRDKDAVSACCMIAETAAWAADQGLTMFDILQQIYKKYGLYLEGLISITRMGKTGAEEIAAMMDMYRHTPPKTIDGAQVLIMKDYKLKKSTNFLTGEVSAIDLPISDVLQFFTTDGSKITIRPSGTEPKIKFYFGVKGVSGSSDLTTAENELRLKIESIKNDMGLIK
ncbi:MAG TPA: phosphoglucomutase [Bacteroidales bacterium]|nr:MAG: phosphoglucomutase [Bacteroidetes bacterium GWE2_42_24]OFY31685.1 MAG: phosphoglucomutase [Bacteroidetes bacterium GWF2_43_11]PKP27843.1 MAG: phosphoglucomutase [Bacteroidetes bacterium HGW-Bacteroidetes-22]HAQ65786.1 phosphoglucomutase [Bacteroidales bacterium]HBZ67049.1 phosphoglucomutase [Bacteroidales bacterium]